MTATLPRQAVRHECLLRNEVGHFGIHTSGTGAPKRKKCAYCGGQLVTRRGWHGVFVHSSFPDAGPSGAAYRIEDAKSLHSRLAGAERVIREDTTGSLVERWVSA